MGKQFYRRLIFAGRHEANRINVVLISLLVSNVLMPPTSSAFLIHPQKTLIRQSFYNAKSTTKISSTSSDWDDFHVRPGTFVDVTSMEVVGSDYSNEFPIDTVVSCEKPGSNFDGKLTERAQVIVSLGPEPNDGSGGFGPQESDFELAENEYIVKRGTKIDKYRMYVLDFEPSPREGGTVLRTLTPGLLGPDGSTVNLAEVVASSGPNGDWKEDRNGQGSIEGDPSTGRSSRGFAGFSSGSLGPAGGPGKQEGYIYGPTKKRSSPPMSPRDRPMEPGRMHDGPPSDRRSSDYPRDDRYDMPDSRPFDRQSSEYPRDDRYDMPDRRFSEFSRDDRYDMPGSRPPDFSRDDRYDMTPDRWSSDYPRDDRYDDDRRYSERSNLEREPYDYPGSRNSSMSRESQSRPYNDPYSDPYDSSYNDPYDDGSYPSKNRMDKYPQRDSPFGEQYSHNEQPYRSQPSSDGYGSSPPDMYRDSRPPYDEPRPSTNRSYGRDEGSRSYDQERSGPRSGGPRSNGPNMYGGGAPKREDSFQLGENEYSVNKGTKIDKTRMYVVDFERSDREGGTVLRTITPGLLGPDGSTINIAEVIASSGPNGDWREEKNNLNEYDSDTGRTSRGMVGFSGGSLGPPGGPGKQDGYTYGPSSQTSTPSPSHSPSDTGGRPDSQYPYSQQNSFDGQSRMMGMPGEEQAYSQQDFYDNPRDQQSSMRGMNNNEQQYPQQNPYDNYPEEQNNMMGMPPEGPDFTNPYSQNLENKIRSDYYDRLGLGYEKPGGSLGPDNTTKGPGFGTELRYPKKGDPGWRPHDPGWDDDFQ